MARASPLRNANKDAVRRAIAHTFLITLEVRVRSIVRARGTGEVAQGGENTTGATRPIGKRPHRKKAEVVMTLVPPRHPAMQCAPEPWCAQGTGTITGTLEDVGGRTVALILSGRWVMGIAPVDIYAVMDRASVLRTANKGAGTRAIVRTFPITRGVEVRSIVRAPDIAVAAQGGENTVGVTRRTGKGGSEGVQMRRHRRLSNCAPVGHQRGID